MMSGPYQGSSIQYGVTIESNVIAGNIADIFGGGLLIGEQSLAAIESNTIVKNQATSGSATTFYAARVERQKIQPNGFSPCWEGGVDTVR